jgi:hypothetical protein
MSLLASTVSFPVSAFPPLAVGFFGLGTGYLIYGPQELLGFPRRSPKVDLATGFWGVWMPGFMQFLTGVYLFVGLTWFHSFTDPPLYMAALAFTAYGVHWWAIGMGRALGGDARPNAFMSIAFTSISALGIVVFFHHAADQGVGILFIGLTCIYVSDFFASLFPAPPPAAMASATAGPQTPAGQRAVRPRLGMCGEWALGFFHLATGLYLMYLTWAAALNFSSGFHLWL